jgi:hypothetical protein
VLRSHANGSLLRSVGVPRVLERGSRAMAPILKTEALPILLKTPRVTQGAPQKIGIKPFKIIESYGKQPNGFIINNFLGGSNSALYFQQLLGRFLHF